MQDAYFENDCCICKNGDKGPAQLTNFVARINRERVYHDAAKQRTFLAIDGRLQDLATDEAGNRTNEEGLPLHEIIVPATEFAGLGWIPEQWGMRPLILPVPGADRDVRTAIQLGSRPTKEHIYTHTGWTKIGQKPAYLTTSGAIIGGKLDASVHVELPAELRHYKLPAPKQDAEAFKNSLRIVNIGPTEVTWPLVLATYRAAMGASDFAVHLAGRTGTYKSEITSLLQSHYGEAMDARHLPGSWSSTGNAVEALAYAAKDALFVLDDFVPHGTAYQVRQLQATADRLFRGQGNQAGRSRLTDVSTLQASMYPRGIILSTGEDVPDGHSVRGRMLILELSPGSVPPAKLTPAQDKRSQYPQAMADWIAWVAETNAYERQTTLARQIRDKHLDIGHSRTPAILGQLIATAQMLMDYAAERGYLKPEETMRVYTHAEAAVLAAGRKQKDHLEAADPVEALMDTIRLLLGAQMAHVKTKNGGIPADPVKFGWTETIKAGSMNEYKSNGPRIGWVDIEDGHFLLDPNALTLLKKHSGGKLAVSPQTLLKRMKESGLITRSDDARQRHTVRLSLEGHQRQALCLDLATVFEESE